MSDPNTEITLSYLTTRFPDEPS